MDRQKPDVKLFFLGKRRWVKAALQLEFALRAMQREHKLTNLADIFVKRYKQLQEVAGPLEIFPENQDYPQGSLCSTVAITISEKPMEYKLIAVPGEIERYPEASYRQVDFRRLSDVEASARLPKVNDFWELLDEAVQLTKIFHIKKYKQDSHYEYVVGGFEQLQYTEAFNDDSVEIKSRIMRHIFHEETIYNHVRIYVESDAKKISFLLPFIGREL